MVEVDVICKRQFYNFHFKLNRKARCPTVIDILKDEEEFKVNMIRKIVKA